MAADSSTPEIGASIVTGAFSTNYHDQGAGPPVLLIHGSGPGVSAWANWRLIIPQMSKRFRVIAPDMVGFGYTQSPPAADYGPDLWVGQVIALLDALGLDKVCVIGNSFGGAVALALTHRHPDRVERLVLMGSVGISFPITPGLDKVWGYEPSPENMRELVQLFAYNQSIATDDLVQMRYRASIRDDVQERFSSLFPAPRQRWVDALALDEDDLRSIRQPTLIIHGRDDQIIPMQASERLAELIPNSQLEILDRCGHWVQIERTQDFLSLVEGFLSQASPFQSSEA